MARKKFCGGLARSGCGALLPWLCQTSMKGLSVNAFTPAAATCQINRSYAARRALETHPYPGNVLSKRGAHGGLAGPSYAAARSRGSHVVIRRQLAPVVDDLVQLDCACLQGILLGKGVGGLGEGTLGPDGLFPQGATGSPSISKQPTRASESKATSSGTSAHGRYRASVLVSTERMSRVSLPG